jgi:hypothetical protein
VLPGLRADLLRRAERDQAARNGCDADAMAILDADCPGCGQALRMTVPRWPGDQDI